MRWSGVSFRRSKSELTNWRLTISDAQELEAIWLVRCLVADDSVTGGIRSWRIHLFGHSAP